MNIALINSIGKHKWGGGEKWMINAALGLMSAGHNVVVVCRQHSRLSQRAKILKLPVKEIGAISDFDITACFRFCSFFRNFRPDMVIGCQNKDWRVASIAIKISGSNARVYSRQGLQSFKDNWWYKWTIKWLSDGIITNTQTIKTYYDSFLPVDDNFIKVVFNGVEPVPYDVSGFDYSQFISSGEKDPVIVLSTGRLARQKGFKYLIDAAAEIIAEHPNIYFFLAGRGKLEKELKARIARHGITRNFILLGFVEDIHSLLANADIFVFPSLYEGMPNSVLEAMAHGLPVISSNVNGIQELIEDGHNGYTVDPSDVSQLKTALKQLVEVPGKRSVVGKNAQKMVKEKFAMKHMVNRLESLIIEAVNSNEEPQRSGVVKWIGQLYSLRHKNLKFLYYAINYIRQLIPSSLYRKRFPALLNRMQEEISEEVNDRVNYYNKLQTTVELKGGKKISDFKLGRKLKTYFFDTFEYLRYFPPHLKFEYVFGDITSVPEAPAFVKSRPVRGDNANSVLLKLNKIRHFTFVNDRKSFKNKKAKLVWRGHLSESKDSRVRFVREHIDHPQCNVGCINYHPSYENLLRERMTIDEQLDYKFILCIEGNDVASNLKWVMSSNSLAVMPRPRYETWFMEGRLIPGYHYVEIRDDFSDLEEKMAYFSNHPDEALAIIENAHEHVLQFRDQRREKLISFMVLDKYFRKTNPDAYN
ncbi:MAG: glycosyl transferase family 90 [Marinilabilia sp.]